MKLKVAYFIFTLVENKLTFIQFKLIKFSLIGNRFSQNNSSSRIRCCRPITKKRSIPIFTTD